MKQTCIYCETSEVNDLPLSISDIIPATLIKTKFTRRHCCETKHNNIFGQTFESDIINNLALLRNHLNLTNKNKIYPDYSSLIEVDRIDYKCTTAKQSLPLGTKVFSSPDKSYKLGPLETIQNFQNSSPQNTKKLDLAGTEVTRKYTINLEIFYSVQIKRLIAKMAYEWFCADNDIKSFNTIFSTIKNFIIEENSTISPVELINNASIFPPLENLNQLGSHNMFSFVENDKIYIFVSFFNIAAYKVELCDNLELFKTNSWTEFTLLRGNNTYKFEDLAKIEFLLKNPKLFEHVPLLFNLGKLITTLPSSSFNNKLKFESLLIKNYQDILNSSILTPEHLIRFIKEFSITEKVFSLETIPNQSDYNLYLYIIFNIGLTNTIEINNILKSLLTDSNVQFQLTKDLGNILRLHIESQENHLNLIKKGANLLITN